MSYLSALCDVTWDNAAKDQLRGLFSFLFSLSFILSRMLFTNYHLFTYNYLLTTTLQSSSHFGSKSPKNPPLSHPTKSFQRISKNFNRDIKKFQFYFHLDSFLVVRYEWLSLGHITKGKPPYIIYYLSYLLYK